MNQKSPFFFLKLFFFDPSNVENGQHGLSTDELPQISRRPTVSPNTAKPRSSEKRRGPGVKRSQKEQREEWAVLGSLGVKRLVSQTSGDFLFFFLA